MKLGEFFIDLLVDAGRGELTVRNLVSGFGELEAITVAEIAALWEVGVRLAALVDQQIKAALGLENFTTQTGESAQELQKWQGIAEQAHVRTDVVTSSFKALSKGLEDMKWGQPSGVLAGAVQILGIDPTGKDVFQVMDAISDELRRRYGKDQKAKEHVLGIIGFDPEMVKLLDLTRQQREQMGKNSPVMSQKQEAQFLKLYDQLILIELKAKRIGLDIASWIAPDATRGFESVLNLMRLIEPLALRIGKIIQLNWRYNPLMLLPKAGFKLDEDLLKFAAGEQSGIGSLFGSLRGVMSSAWGGSAPLPGTPAYMLQRDFEEHPTNVDARRDYKFYIEGAHDPEQTARTVKRHLAGQNDDTEYLLDRGATK